MAYPEGVEVAESRPLVIGSLTQPAAGTAQQP